MTNKQKEYMRKYGNIPVDFFDRMVYLIEDLIPSKREVELLKEKVISLVSSINWNHMSFIFYFVPEASPRPRYSGVTKSFYVKGAKGDSTFFEDYINTSEERPELIKTQCSFNCDVFFPTPSDMNRMDKLLSELRLIRPLSTPDWDNVGKKYCDMVQTHIMLNDSLVIDGRVRKYYSSKPRVEIYISYADDYDSLYNKRKVHSWKSFPDETV
jgi:Holliday junction resolvase RusA-like endonuclease